MPPHQRVHTTSEVVLPGLQVWLSSVSVSTAPKSGPLDIRLLNSYKVVALRTWMFISSSCDCHLKSWRHAQYFSIKHKFQTLVEFYFLECVLSHSVYPTLLGPWIISRRAPLSMGFPRLEYWSGLPCPILEALLDPGIESAFLVSPALGGRSWEAPFSFKVYMELSAM